MNNLVLNPLSASQLDQFTNYPAHMLIIVGPDGGGKMAVAQSVLEDVMNVQPGQFYRTPFGLILSPEKGIISINAVRELQKFMNLKTTGTAELRRGVIIEHADKLTIEAQNALLKLMEEPPSDTVIVMTVNGSTVLLPTMYSRSQIINLRRPTKDNLVDHFTKGGYEISAVNRAYLLTNGLPGLVNALLNSGNDHPLNEAVETAKKILRISRYDKFLLINDLSKDKTKLHSLFFALQRIAQSSLNQTLSTNSNNKNVIRCHTILKQALIADNELALNANAKLVLSNLFLSI